MNKYSHLFASNGPFVSSQHWSFSDRHDTEVFFHHSQKAQIMLTACSSWFGGDFFEFGSHDLNTFRDFLTAYDICGMSRAYEDVRFYAFDAFGKFPAIPDVKTEFGCDLKGYFKPYSDQGDQIELHKKHIVDHGLYADKCHLVQGLFHDTCTSGFKEEYGDRKIGFASIDCNLAWSYKTVFEFIFSMMAENSYIYMDEGIQNPDVIAQWEQFRKMLRHKRHMDAIYVRNAAGFGSLWRLHPITNNYALEL